MWAMVDAHLQDEEYKEARSSLALHEEHIPGGGRTYVPARYWLLAARTVAPFAVLFPGAVWIATSADALFAGVSAWR